jgi:folate-binding protein YgfZ
MRGYNFYRTFAMSAVPQTVAVPPSPVVATPLAAYLAASDSALGLASYRGVLTPSAFLGADQELVALTGSAGIYDLGYSAFLKITGSDRLRWLNGMVTNTVQSLEESHWNYSFLLNAQGRILGDATNYRSSDHILLQTDRAQIARLTTHLDHFVIMDDVELQELDASTTSIGITGPRSAEILGSLGFTLPGKNAFVTATLNDVEVTLVHAHSPIVPRFEIWLPTASLPEIWAALSGAGAIPCGVAAIEALRILSATPLYGVDIHERYLAQETAQTRALNFDKGCYLGQEIVERIRSRATIHRTLQQFSLTGAAPVLKPGQALPLNAEQAERNPVGDLTSIAHYQLPAFTGTLALGFIRTEVLERKFPITYGDGDGAATPLDAPPI